MLLYLSLSLSLAARDTALDPPADPAASATMQSVIDSLLARSHERRASHEALQDADEAAADEAIGQAVVEPSPAASLTADAPPAQSDQWTTLPDPLPESLAVAESVPAVAESVAAAPAAAPTAAELQAAEAKVARLTDELMRLRGMPPNCTDAPTELATAPIASAPKTAPSPTPATCPGWIDSVREAIRSLDQCQAELDDLNQQLAEREGLLARLRAAPPNATVKVTNDAAATPALTASPCPTVNETLVTVGCPHSTTPNPFPAESPDPFHSQTTNPTTRPPTLATPTLSPPTLSPLAE